MKYTADDLAKALIYLGTEITYSELLKFMDSLNLNNEYYTNVNDALYELSADEFLDRYNKYFKNTLKVGDVYRLIDTCHGCERLVVTEYDEETDKYYVLLDNGTFALASNDTFDFDNAEKITKTFIHSKNDLINKANEL